MAQGIPGVPLIGGRIAFNVKVKAPLRARAALEATRGSCLVAVVTKEYTSVAEAVKSSVELGRYAEHISVGLGDGDKEQWEAALEVAARTGAAHLNQPFASAGYAVGYLRGMGNAKTVVNALVCPGGRVGRVKVIAGSGDDESADLPVDDVMALLHDAQVPSVKLFPLRRPDAVEHVRAVAMAAARAGLGILEPSGGVTPDNLCEILEAAMPSGLTIIPHLYGALAGADGDLDLAKLARCVAIAESLAP